MRRFHCAALAAVAVIGFASVASAADMPAKAPMYTKAPVMAPAYNWTGFYVGGNVGYGWGTNDTTNDNGNPPFPAGTQSSDSPDGWLGGLQTGFNYEFPSNVVIGIEGDYDWSDLTGNSSGPSVVPGFTTTRFDTKDTKINWMATLTGRLGYAMNNWLIYAKGGAAWAHTEGDSTTVNPAAGNLLLATTTGDETRTGWTVGGGVEWGFWQNWSAKLEYDYLDFGTTTVTRAATYYNGASGLNPLLRDSDLHVSVVKLGINYRFNWMH